MPVLTLSAPVWLKDHFEMPVDETHWNSVGTPDAYRSMTGGKTPARKRATFHTHSRSMKPKSDYGLGLATTGGVYMLAFGGENGLEPAFYVGISQSSVLDRLRRHRVKAIGSNVASAASTSVNHTEGWVPFAQRRYIAHKGLPDRFEDVRLIVGLLDVVATKALLGQFERSIDVNHNGVQDLIKELLWPNFHELEIAHLTSSTATQGANAGDVIQLWSGQPHRFS
jgi:hypothetical protein